VGGGLTLSEIQCPICRINAELIKAEDYGRHKGYKCLVCGPYFITATAEAIAKNNSNSSRLSAWIREYKENNLNPPQITSDILENILKNLPVRTPLEKQLILLRAIEQRTMYPGAEVSLSQTYDYPLAWASNSNELSYLLNALKERGFIILGKTTVGTSWTTVILTAGWEYLDRNASKPAFTNQAFVAMSFDNALDPVWENGIRPAVQKAGYKPHRIDKEPHTERIDAKIITDIKDSLFVIADVTEQKQGVYFEAGFAIGLNKPVIWCVNKKHLKKVHFDNRQFNHIVWETPEELQEKLYNVICAVIGKRE
jgi:nucleoside 2-deoxyribosyltransferase